MAEFYNHFGDDTLILDSSENIMTPLLGSLLGWTNLRLGVVFSITSQTGSNDGFSSFETMPISNGLPVTNRLSIGLKTAGVSLPGEDGCSFFGLSNNSDSIGSSLGFWDNKILMSTNGPYIYNVNIEPTGAGGYSVTSEPQIIQLSQNFNNSGSFYSVPPEETINFSGLSVKLENELLDGDSQIIVKADPSVVIYPDNWNGEIVSEQVYPEISLGYSAGSGLFFDKDNSISNCVLFSSSQEMKTGTGYATALILNFKITNKNLPSQTVQVGSQIITGLSSISSSQLSSLMSYYSPNFESSIMNYDGEIPNSFFIRWPFQQARLRLHSYVVKRV